MKNILRFTLLAFILNMVSCTTARHTSLSKDDGKIEVVFVQINDVYEIAPLSGGKEGGMARVATLKKQWLQKNPNTFLVMAGDFLSPSVYNSLQYEGKAIRGRQMVEAMNSAGMDLAVFGNHEFDIKETELQERINESAFQWVSSNTFHQQKGKSIPFTKTNSTNAIPFPKTFIKTVKDADGTTARIGFFGITLPFNKAGYVSYTDPLTTAREMYNQLKDSVDAVIAVTHQSIDDDIEMAKEIPGLALVLGGHEHDMRFKKEGKIFITKAHANAKSAFVVKLLINKKSKKITVDPQLKYMDETMPLDSSTNNVVQKWVQIAANNYSSLGFDARKEVLTTGKPLDGRETEIRTHATNLTELVISAMMDVVPQADAVLFNAGSIRVDDVLQLPVTQYDIIRTLPFGGGIREVDMKGRLLMKTLDAGQKNTGIGGFLLYNPSLTNDAVTHAWQLNGTPIDPAKTYHVAMAEFLLTGKEANLDFLSTTNADVVKVYDAATSVSNPRSDIRLAIVQYLQKKK